MNHKATAKHNWKSMIIVFDDYNDELNSNFSVPSE